MHLFLKLLRPLLPWLLGAVIALGCYFLLRQPAAPPPSLTPELLRLEVSQRLRLITEEITYRQDVDLYFAGQHAIGTTDLVAYVKYDLDELQITPAGQDSFLVALPTPAIEIGRRPRGQHDVRYYLDQGGRPGAPSADRQVISQLNKRLLQEVEEDIRSNPRFLPQAQRSAQQQLQRLLQPLAPKAHFIFHEPIYLPPSELPHLHDQR